MPFSDEPPLLLAGTAHPDLAQAIAKASGYALLTGVASRFPDNEIKVQIGENVRGRDVFVVQPTHATEKSSSDNFLELLIIIDALRRASAARITAVTTYFGHGRQDRKDDSRVPITAKALFKALEGAGTSRFLTIDLHSGQSGGFPDVPVDQMHAGSEIREYIRTLKLNPLVVVASDVGAIRMARAYAKRLGCRIAACDKERLDDTEVGIRDVIGDVAGKHALLVDDETSTTMTQRAAAEALMKRGAASVRCAVTHAKLNDKTVALIDQSLITEFIITDTMPQPPLTSKFRVISVAKIIAYAIERIHADRSLSDLFD